MLYYTAPLYSGTPGAKQRGVQQQELSELLEEEEEVGPGRVDTRAAPNMGPTGALCICTYYNGNYIQCMYVHTYCST